MTDYTEVAIHEAGHCVAAHEYLHDFSYVSLHSDKGYSQEGSSAHVKLSPSVEPSTGVSWQWLQRKTRMFVALHWPEIIRVASALRERKVMTAGDIRRVIDEKED